MKDQFVIACLSDIDMDAAAASHAAYLAKMLGKGLILLHVDDARHGSESESIETRLRRLESQYAELRPSHVAMKGSWREIINALPTLLNGVIAVVGVNPAAERRSLNHPRQLLRMFGECKIAYLTVQAPLASRYQSVGYGIDFHKESKEKLIWASYFARFNHSRLHMLHYCYKDEGLRLKWQNNVRFMNKFFKGLGVEYDAIEVAGRAIFPETQICARAAEKGCDLLISVTTDLRDQDVLEWFIGTQEQRTIQNRDRLPVLFLNPRDDIYVLCD